MAAPVFAEKIQKRLNEQRKNGSMCDVTLRVGSQDYKAHKNVLSAVSDYFRAMFGGYFKDAEKTIINLDETPVTALDVILDAVYNNELKLTMENIESILISADFLQMPTILELCETFLKDNLSVESCINGLTLSTRFHLEKQTVDAAETVIAENFLSLSRTGTFKKLEYDNVLEMFKRKDLVLESREIEVFRAMCFWLEDRELSEDLVDSMLTNPEYIDYRNIPENLLREEVLKHKVVNNVHRRTCVEDAVKFVVEYNRNIYKQPLVSGERKKRPRGVKCYAAASNDHSSLEFHYMNKDYTVYRQEEVPVSFEKKYVTHGDSFIFVYGTKVMLRYDVSHGSWLQLTPPPSIGEVYSYLYITMTCSKHHIYIIGNRLDPGGVYVQWMFEYTIESDTWKELPRMPVLRIKDSAICYSPTNDMVYVAGGYDVGHRPCSHLFAYDVKAQSWSVKAPMIRASKDSITERSDWVRLCDRFSLTELNGCLYSVGGPIYAVEEYNIASNQWNTVASEIPDSCRLRYGSFALDEEVIMTRAVFTLDGGCVDKNCLLTFNPKEKTFKQSVMLSTPPTPIGAVIVPLTQIGAVIVPL
jgi:hypothetical protein